MNDRNQRKNEAETASSPEAAQHTQEENAGSYEGVMPHGTTSALQDVAKGVKDVVAVAATEAIAWANAKVDKLSEKKEDGTGPYSSPATCVPSDFDCIASGVLPAMPAENAARKDSKQEGSGNTDDDGPTEKK
ncbi:hypothetical protein CC80DRAFT_587837 [Byssothecium circinans]|uniref:Uncharacterized protein n=1 Tax=Byssothecium circinans TaxID=147558 RepID=A0A6A5UFB1_9PLEO|nr:hypothetical protein CC80DRAFT_587837 [Byssothecium circinans]